LCPKKHGDDFIVELTELELEDDELDFPNRR
jgi:hypothetical protein